MTRLIQTPSLAIALANSLPGNDRLRNAPQNRTSSGMHLARCAGRRSKERRSRRRQGDTTFTGARLVTSASAAMVWSESHFTSQNRSRTWVISRNAAGLRLKHDHRHEDGSEDKLTQDRRRHRGRRHACAAGVSADLFTANLLRRQRPTCGPSSPYWAARSPGPVAKARTPADSASSPISAKPIAAPPPPWGAK